MAKGGVGSHTVYGELGFDGVGGAEVIGDDTLVFPFAGESHAAQPQDGGVLHHLPALGPEVRVVFHFGVLQQLVVLLPRERHRGVTAAGRRADKAQVGTFYGRLCFWLNRDLGFREIICSKWRGGNKTILEACESTCCSELGCVSQRDWLPQCCETRAWECSRRNSFSRRRQIYLSITG